MHVYWKRLDITPANRVDWRRQFLSSSAWVLAVVGGARGGGRHRTVAGGHRLVGLVPTSGGTDWSDPEARSGVGDGDNEVAASEHPESVGFTESEIYLETDRPSLYDAFNESYGEPLKPKKQDKMIALGQQDVGEQKERPAENLQAGSRVLRRPAEAASRVRPRPGERAGEGSGLRQRANAAAPAALGLQPFRRHQSGVKNPAAVRAFPPSKSRKAPGSGCRGRSRRFSSGTVVAPGQDRRRSNRARCRCRSHVTRFRVGSVNRLDFFGWAQYGIIRMTDRTVPAGTVIDCEARTVDPRRLRFMFDRRPARERGRPPSVIPRLVHRSPAPWPRWRGAGSRAFRKAGARSRR